MKQNRRSFLQLAGAAATGTFFSSFENLTMQSLNVKTTPGYQLKVLATNWGFDGNTDTFCARAKKDGYDGIEIWWPGTVKAQAELFDAVKKYDLDLGLLYGAGEGTYKEHAATFIKTLDEITGQKHKQPLYINLHSGKDYFSFADNSRLIEHSITLSKQTGIPLYHETHRGRMLFAAPVTNDFINKYPELKLTLDISHWCNVHESLLNDQPGNVAAALQRTEHIHARVGYQEGPQVADPRAPEWEYAVKAHVDWWDKVVERKKKAGEQITFLTEFGPPLYMQTLPYTLQPLSNQWDINVHMMKLLRKRYA